MRKSARRPIPWRSTSNAPVPSVAAIWGSLSLNGRPRCLCKRSMGAVWRVAIDSPGYSCKAESRPCGRHCSSFTTLGLSVLRPRRKRARSAPKRHSSRLCRASVFLTVVAKPIQDMSEVSIPIKTVGNRCRVCGAEQK